MVWRILIGVGGAVVVTWLVLAIVLIVARPKGSLLREAIAILPNTLRLLRRLATDRTLARGVRIRLWLLFAYLAMPFDLIPDFLPVIGQADDVIIACAVLRGVVRRAGPDAIRRHWPGSPDGLAALWRVARLPGVALTLPAPPA